MRQFTPFHSRWQSFFLAGLFLVAGISRASAQPQPQPPDPQTPPAKSDTSKASLPPNYQPPRAVPAVMTLEKELMTESEAKDIYNELCKDNYGSIFRNVKFDNATKPIIEKWAKWRLYQMTIKSNRKRLHEVRAELIRDIFQVGQLSSVAQKDVERFRYFLCEEVTKRATELLSNNFHARLNAAIVLAQLNVSEERKDVKEHAYVGAAIPLMEVLNAKTGGGLDEQLEAVKIQAAIGLQRIFLSGKSVDLKVIVGGQDLRNRMANTLIAQLKDPKAHFWYQKRLIDALACVELDSNVSIVVQQLGEVLADQSRHPCVRARAARGLGRCQLPAGLNTEKLMFQILLLEHELATAYQKDPNAYYWHDCFSDVYFAFHPVSDEEIKIYGNQRSPGLNRKPKLGAAVKDAFDQIIPITKHVVGQPGWKVPKDGKVIPKNEKIPDQMVDDLVTWLNAHKPTDHKLAPNLPELAPASPVPAPSAATTTSG